MVAPVTVHGPPGLPTAEVQVAGTDVDQPGNRMVRENEPARHDQDDQVRLDPAGLPLDEGWRTAATGRRGVLERWYTAMRCPAGVSTPTVGTPRNEHAVLEVLWNSTAPAGEVGADPGVYNSTEVEICDGVHEATGFFWATDRPDAAPAEADADGRRDRPAAPKARATTAQRRTRSGGLGGALMRWSPPREAGSGPDR